MLVAALSATVAATASGSGGIGAPGTPASAASHAARLGARTLKMGMAGDDVRVLNGIVKSKPYVHGVRLINDFQSPTAVAVRSFQRRSALAPTGVVNHHTAQVLTGSMKRVDATWYGPGFYGNHTACGPILRLNTIGVANNFLPCGTKVTFAYHGRYLVVPVIDRGPYSPPYRFDLTRGAGKLLGFDYSDKIRFAVDR